MMAGFGVKRGFSVLLVAAAFLAGASLRANPEQKLTGAIEVLRQFDAGAGEVEVIVTLAEAPGRPARNEWDSRAKLRAWQQAVGSRQAEVLDTLPANEFRLRHLFENQSGFAGFATRRGLEKLALHPRVISIQYSRPVQPQSAQGIPRINAAASRSTYGGAGVAIAIIDSGIDYTHPQLGGTNVFPNGKVIGGTDLGDSDGNPMPNGNAHGTACAGIAAGNVTTNAGDYIGGVAPDAKLYAVKITAGSATTTTDADIIAAWNWCITHKNDDPNNLILVISTSYGGGRYSEMCDGAQLAYAVAAANANSAGITLLVASGNQGHCDATIAPACVSGVIACGAVYDAAFGSRTFCIDQNSCAPTYSHPGCAQGFRATDDVTAADKVARYSNTAHFLGLLAPGHRAHTTDIVGAGGSSTTDYFAEFGGTSAAAPYAAGAVAALQSAARALRGSYLSPAEVRTLLTDTGDAITDPKATHITKPRVNVGKAIEALMPPRLSAARTNDNVVISWPTNNSGGYVLQWTHALAGVAWSNVPTTVVTVGTNYHVTNTIVPGPKFYRLRK